MTVDDLAKLLEVYTLEEILQAVDLDDLSVLVILSDQGFLDELELPRPL